MSGILSCGAILVVLVFIDYTIASIRNHGGHRGYDGHGHRGNHGYGSASERGKQFIDIYMPMNFYRQHGNRHHGNRGYGYESHSGSNSYRSDSGSHSYGSDFGSHNYRSGSDSYDSGLVTTTYPQN